MSETFLQGLTITLIGMSMVFAALALMWGLIAVLTRVHLPSRLSSQPDDPTILSELENTEPGPHPSAEEMAAIAAALALLRAEQEAESSLPWRLPPTLTRWAAIGYGRNLAAWQPPRDRSGGKHDNLPPSRKDQS